MATEYVRQILTVYYADFQARHPVKKIRSMHANTACTACFNHMQLNHYGAAIAEVHDERDGVLHAVFKRSINGDVHALFEREVKEGM
jgi:hypothetical protein